MTCEVFNAATNHYAKVLPSFTDPQITEIAELDLRIFGTVRAVADDGYVMADCGIPVRAFWNESDAPIERSVAWVGELRVWRPKDTEN